MKSYSVKPKQKVAVILTRISHQEICLWARRPENGAGNVPAYVEQTIFQTTQTKDKFRSVGQSVLLN